VTWAFLYLASLLVSLVLAGVTGLLRDLRALGRRHLVMPHADHHSGFLAVVGPRIACGLGVFSVLGLVSAARHWFDPLTAAGVASGAGLAACFLSALVLRRRSVPQIRPNSAVVAREMPPGGYGQVRFDHEGKPILMAAQSIDSQLLPVGMVVEVVDATRSVVTVRRSPSGT